MNDPITHVITGIALDSTGPVKEHGFPAFVRTRGRRVGSVHATTDKAWSTGVITVYKSNDGVTRQAIGAGLTLGPGEDFEALSGIDYAGLMFSVTTAESGAVVNLHIHLTDSE